MMRYTISLVTALALGACGPTQSGPAAVAGPAPAATSHHPVGTLSITDENDRVYEISQGQPGDPAMVGCADGQREAFVDASAFPAVAGCLGEWAGTMSLRAPATGAACGDDRGACGAPADACAPGWHVCGASGKINEVFAIGADSCERAGGGRFVAAISHCEEQVDCTYDRPDTGDYQCFERGWCSEPVCCGNDCGDFGVCADGVWPGKTHIPLGQDQGCGAINASRARGVLCCKG